MARLPALEPPFTTDVATRLAAMMPPGAPPIGLFRTFAKNLPMTAAMSPWGGYELSRQLSLTLREREIVIVRTCARCGCEYEWGVHVMVFADRAGLTRSEIASLTHGHADDSCWSAGRERVLIQVADALHDASDISDELWDSARAVLDEPQLLDLLMLCGWYHAVSFAARATRVDLEPGAPRFADVTP
ncbi:carboxymuconolactone decarboxylase family protein [Actinoplanes awajinensis]|uniref:Carboxymuconolactone decarboxylase n=1 Tax=Actinoplanes awajinensis subsp. mycoplanecinus TaxID=135947 RepID=A0A101JQ12_9ACTN|nr:carboxymuconolactone decarboxylase family protein [Actinoplanes awajinensis]KUL31025.1 carboxymuconolactone decarboxylase [Actinoplanes awajinensis subsp. mycoplanecinus]